MTDSITEAREARKAALLAKRATRPATETLTVTFADLRVGDFINTIPTQAGVRGERVNAFVARTEARYDEWGQRGTTRRMQPVPSTAAELRTGDRITVTVSRPDTFRVVIRRAVTA